MAKGWKTISPVLIIIPFSPLSLSHHPSSRSRSLRLITGHKFFSHLLCISFVVFARKFAILLHHNLGTFAPFSPC